MNREQHPGEDGGSASRIYRVPAIPSKDKTTKGADTPPPAYGLAPESALGSHPCVALSSAPVQTSVQQLADNSTGQFTC